MGDINIKQRSTCHQICLFLPS